MYAAHKAAGGMTSVYRQIGKACESIFRQVLQDHLGLSSEEAAWQYQVPKDGGGTRTLTLDGRIPFRVVSQSDARDRIVAWSKKAMQKLMLPNNTLRHIEGLVFEVRQGYKSKDSKRQNADIANASNAYANLYVPILLVFSTQIDDDLAERYAAARWLLLKGDAGGTSLESTYVFLREIIGYDLAKFFERNSKRFKVEVESILSTLLQGN